MADVEENPHMNDNSEESDIDDGNEEMDTEPTEGGDHPEEESTTEGGGEEEPPLVKDERYSQLVSMNVKKRVAREFCRLMDEGKITMADVDKKVAKKLCALRVEDGIRIVKRFGMFNLDHMANKSAFLLSQIVMFRQQKGHYNHPAAFSANGIPGPDPEKMTELLLRTGYLLDITTRGRRRYGGPPPGWEGDQPLTECSVYVTGLPQDMYEDILVPLFEKFGRIWQMCLMADPFTNLNPGFCYLTYCKDEEAQRAVEELNGYEIREGEVLKANISIPHVTLFAGSLPNDRTKEEIKEVFGSKTEGLMGVELLPYEVNSEEKNSIPVAGLLTYSSYKLSSEAKRRFKRGDCLAFDRKMHIAKADTRGKPPKGCLEKVTLIHIHQMPPSHTVRTLQEQFQKFGEIEYVEKNQDHGFVKFASHQSAIKAMVEHKGVWRQACTLFMKMKNNIIQAGLDQEYGAVIIDISMGEKQDHKKKLIRGNNRNRRRGARGRGYMHWGRGGNGLLPLPPQFMMRPTMYRGGLPMPPPPEDLWAYEEYMCRDLPPYRGRDFHPSHPYNMDYERYGGGHAFKSGSEPRGYTSHLGPSYSMEPRRNHWDTWHGWDRPQQVNHGQHANKRKSGTAFANRGKKRIKSQSK
ncbi:heterogeneous nuclear ribonucleoprotein Q-like isoform X2 [Pomacea canaliculata]|uniref:heterogeneous nuclear ribonucleoprotein Q-like isoform X2 n=1 Tax=Pomacea canaliculata TaxID=400727 RepID=UPI000D73E1FF|nr:heterogeneous nuclear ribonucleoprotein Q-like isoform X2 [Pomacea canaliculata]